MNYKVICEVGFPAFDTILDIELPINKTVDYVCKMLDKIIVENITSNYTPKENSILINKRTGDVYDKNVLLKQTDIRNGSKLTYY